MTAGSSGEGGLENLEALVREWNDLLFWVDDWEEGAAPGGGVTENIRLTGFTAVGPPGDERKV